MSPSKLGLSMIGLLVIPLAACKPGDRPGSEYMPDMAYSRSYKAFAPNQGMRSGITLQRPVPGTIARGHAPFPYGAGVSEAERAGAELRNPFRPTAPILEKGKALYGIYCAVCHGAEGKGDGPIAGKIPPPPSYRSTRLLAFSAGRLYHVISRGAGKMAAYATLLPPDDRWLVATYVRAELQGLPEELPAAPTAPAVPPAPAAPAALPAPSVAPTEPGAPR